VAEFSREDLLDVVTALSGSGPAYVFLFIEALADGAVRSGMGREEAILLASSTVEGAARMVRESGKHPGQLKDLVTSPGGTTAAGIAALERGAFRGTVMDAVFAAWQRCRELSS
jgi:pyrroline-5-carboxylate reductase